MNMIIEIINNQNECNGYCCLGISIVLCTLIVCVTIVVYRLLLVLRDIIEDTVIGLMASVTFSKWYICTVSVLIVLVLFSLIAVLSSIF